MASVPLVSAPENSSDAITSFAVRAASPDFNCKIIGVLSPLGVCCNINPSLCECKIATSASAPIDIAAPSDNIKISSPTDTSAPTPTPPPTTNAPLFVALVAVVLLIVRTPALDIASASVSLAEPIVPASGMTMFQPVVISPAPV